MPLATNDTPRPPPSPEGSARSEMWLMIVATAVQFGTVFGCVGLLWAGIAFIVAGTVHATLWLLLVLMLVLGAWNLLACIDMIIRPRPRKLWGILARTLATFVPPIVMIMSA